jgi:hypothetical protein
MGNSATLIPNPSLTGRRRELRSLHVRLEVLSFSLREKRPYPLAVSPVRCVLKPRQVRFMVKKEAGNEPDEGLQASQSSLFHMMLEVFEFRQTPSAGFCCNVERNSNIK